MITVNSVHLSFTENGRTMPVLEDISFSIEKKSSCAIIGPSGCGKTSLLFLLSGLRKPDKGTITIEGNPKSGTILQNYGLLPWKNIRENIGLGLKLQNTPKDKIRKKVDKLLEQMELCGFDAHFPSQPSGGMQQRVALARALAIEPEILYMDEPLSSLDSLTRERLQNLIVKIWKTSDITPILVTHSIEEAVYLGEKIIVMSKRPGKITQIVSNPGAGDADYRQNDVFFNQCRKLRTLLRADDNGQ